MEIDDFGSGYSSFNVLKLDMRFLSGEVNVGRGSSIIESVIRMAKWIGMKVIAEGVETKSQANFLRPIGCLLVQGYLYGKPMPVAEFETLSLFNIQFYPLIFHILIKGVSRKPILEMVYIFNNRHNQNVMV